MKHQYVIVTIVALALPLAAFGHGLVTTQTQIVSDYYIEFEYNTIGNVVAGEYTLYAAYLLNPETLEGLDFDSVFFRIQKQNGPAMIGANLASVPDVKGYVAMSGVLNDPGAYTAEVSFYKNNKAFVRSNFNFNVEKASLSQVNSASGRNTKWSLAGLGLIVGLILGVAGSILKSKGLYKAK